MYKAPLVSVVITTKNEERNIRRCLSSIAAQTYTNIEVIVVDNFSTDRTVEFAFEYTSNVYLKGPERSAQRNFGISEKSNGAFVLYMDADMAIGRTVIESCVLDMARSNAVGLYIPEVIAGSNLFCKVRNFERSFYSGTCIDAVRFFPRSTFCDVGGFDEVLFKYGSGEDWDLDKKFRLIGNCKLLNIGILRHLKGPDDRSLPENNQWPADEIPDPSENFIYHDESEVSLMGYLKKKYYYSAAFQAYINKWGSDDPDVRRQFGFFYRYFIVFTQNGKWRALLREPFLASLMVALRVLVGLTFIFRQAACKRRA